MRIEGRINPYTLHEVHKHVEKEFHDQLEYDFGHLIRTLAFQRVYMPVGAFDDDAYHTMKRAMGTEMRDEDLDDRSN
jgi:hypothetical protein